ncbi:MAG: putative phosphodiesterase [Akkermansiaceae bacterium]|jgi:predicted phosphodiesterase
MNTNDKPSRRSVIKTISLCSSTYLFTPSAFGATAQKKPLCFGLISDVHQDVMHDGVERLGAFVKAMNQQKPDFVCQLGDFCVPHDRNQAFMEEWKKIESPKHHVIGNHDMDGGYKPQQTMKFWGMEKSHYTFDSRGVRFIVLDGNEPGGKVGGYKRFISKKQMDWLHDQLGKSSLPVIVFIHQPVDGHLSGIENSAELRGVLAAAKTPKGDTKVIACFCGHNHDNSAVNVNGIHYLRINSASYLWMGGKYKKEMYDKEIHKKHPYISATVPYKTPIWASIEIDLTAGKMIVKGAETSWVGLDPWERGITEKIKDPKVVAPRISDRTLGLNPS